MQGLYVTKPRRIVFFILLFSIMLIFGIIENFKGVSFPLIKTEFDATWEQQGLLVSMLAISYVGFCIVAGIFLGRFGIKASVIIGFAAISTGLFSVFFMPGFFAAGAALFIIFAGFGFFEVGLNALASFVFVTKTALLMNILHAFYGIGAFTGPIAAGFITNNAGLNWRFIYILTLPFALLLFIPTIFVKFPEGKEETNAPDTSKKKSFLDALTSPMVWLLALSLGLCIVIEHSSPNWGALYFQDIYGLDPRTSGAAFVSTFFICFTVSRLVCGILVERIGYIRSLIGVTVIIFCIFLAGFLLGARGIYVLPVLGFFIGPLWPTIMAAAILYFGKDAPVMCSAMIAIAGTLNAGVQYLIGLTNSFFGPAWGYRSALVYTLMMIAVLVIIGKKIKINEIRK